MHRFKAEYIKPASQPPPRPKPNLYYESHMYQQLLHRALHLSRVASAVPPWELLNSFELQGPTLDTLLRDPSSTSAAKTVHPVDINPFISS